MADEENKSYKRFILFLGGVFVLTLGMTLNLRWWPEFIDLLKGAIGITLAMGGLLMMYGVNKDKDRDKK
ncbi:MAG: hypothetical protein ACI8Q2_000662 [Candidatus Omnitrophota bacterium]|jgi:hypothetical protein